jgi:hypothetical protein
MNTARGNANNHSLLLNIRCMCISSQNVKSTTFMFVMRSMISAQDPGQLQADHLRFCSPCFYQGLRKTARWEILQIKLGAVWSKLLSFED